MELDPKRVCARPPPIRAPSASSWLERKLPRVLLSHVTSFMHTCHCARLACASRFLAHESRTSLSFHPASLHVPRFSLWEFEVRRFVAATQAANRSRDSKRLEHVEGDTTRCMSLVCALLARPTRATLGLRMLSFSTQVLLSALLPLSSERGRLRELTLQGDATLDLCELRETPLTSLSLLDTVVVVESKKTSHTPDAWLPLKLRVLRCGLHHFGNQETWSGLTLLTALETLELTDASDVYYSRHPNVIARRPNLWLENASAMQTLARCLNLTSLSCPSPLTRGYAIQSSDFLALANLRTRYYGLNFGASLLENVRQLRYLDLSGYPTDLPPSLSLATQLESLDLSRCNLNAPEIRLVARLTTLRRLRLRDNRHREPSSFLPLSSLSRLQALDLHDSSECPKTGALMHLPAIASLRTLCLSNCTLGVSILGGSRAEDLSVFAPETGDTRLFSRTAVPAVSLACLYPTLTALVAPLNSLEFVTSPAALGLCNLRILQIDQACATAWEPHATALFAALSIVARSWPAMESIRLRHDSHADFDTGRAFASPEVMQSFRRQKVSVIRSILSCASWDNSPFVDVL